MGTSFPWVISSSRASAHGMLKEVLSSVSVAGSKVFLHVTLSDAMMVSVAQAISFPWNRHTYLRKAITALRLTFRSLYIVTGSEVCTTYNVKMQVVMPHLQTGSSPWVMPTRFNGNYFG